MNKQMDDEKLRICNKKKQTLLHTLASTAKQHNNWELQKKVMLENIFLWMNFMHGIFSHLQSLLFYRLDCRRFACGKKSSIEWCRLWWNDSSTLQHPTEELGSSQSTSWFVTWVLNNAKKILWDVNSVYWRRFRWGVVMLLEVNFPKLSISKCLRSLSQIVPT